MNENKKNACDPYILQGNNVRIYEYKLNNETIYNYVSYRDGKLIVNLNDKDYRKVKEIGDHITPFIGQKISKPETSYKKRKKFTRDEFTHCSYPLESVNSEMEIKNSFGNFLGCYRVEEKIIVTIYLGTTKLTVLPNGRVNTPSNKMLLQILHEINNQIMERVLVEVSSIDEAINITNGIYTIPTYLDKLKKDAPLYSLIMIGFFVALPKIIDLLLGMINYIIN